MLINLRRKLFFSFWLGLCSMPVFAGPFGLNFGATLHELKSKTTLEATNSRFVFVMKNPVIPHEAFLLYRVIVTPEFGLCAIIATSEFFNLSSEDSRLYSQYLNLENALTKKYGEPLSRTPKELSSNSLSNLGPEERVEALWTDFRKPLPDQVAQINLKVRSSQSLKPYIELSYQSKDGFACALMAIGRENEGL